MSNRPIAALVGRSNVGKSTLFNRIIASRKSITSKEWNTTRDRLYGTASWNDFIFTLIDTGGLSWDSNDYQTHIRAQAEIAVDEADLIVFVVDYQTGITDEDLLVAKILRQTAKPVLLAVNKYDHQADDSDYKFLNLGFKNQVLISSLHGIGIGDLLDLIVTKLKPLVKSVDEDDRVRIRFSLIGRPNVGKSSLTNCLLQQDRMMTSHEPGTTRDAVDINFTWHDQEYEIVDTAGVRRKSRAWAIQLEKYAVLRSLTAIDNSDVILLIFDASEPVTKQDLTLAQNIAGAFKPVILVGNKCDLLPPTTDQQQLVAQIANRFKFLKQAPIVLVSAKTKKRVNKLLPLITSIYEKINYRMQTSELNAVIQRAQLINPPPAVNKRRLKIYYATQTNIGPPVVSLFVNSPDSVHFSYRRYLENQLREHFDLAQVPLKLKFVARQKNKSRKEQ